MKMDELPNKKQLKKAFYKITDGEKEMDKDEFRKLCSKFYLTTTGKETHELFSSLDKDSDSRLSFKEVKVIFDRAWKPQSEVEAEFKKDLKLCRTCEGPITRDEIKSILQRGSDEKMTEEEIAFCLHEMDLDGDGQISEDELCSFLFRKDEILSRATSRAESRRRSRSRDSSRSGSRKRKGSKERKHRSGSRERKHRSGSRERKHRSGSRERKHRSGSRERKHRNKSRDRSGSKDKRKRSKSRERKHKGKRRGSAGSILSFLSDDSRCESREGDIVVVNQHTTVINNNVDIEPEMEQGIDLQDRAPEYVEATTEQNGTVEEATEQVNADEENGKETTVENEGQTVETGEESEQQQPDTTEQEAQETAPEPVPEPEAAPEPEPEAAPEPEPEPAPEPEPEQTQEEA